MFLPRSHAVCVCRVHQPSPNWYSSNSAFHVVTSSGRERWRTFHWVSPIPLAFTWRLMPPSGLSQQRTFLIEKSTPVAAQSWHQVRKQHGSPPALWFRLCIQGALGLRQKGLKCIIAFIAQDPPPPFNLCTKWKDLKFQHYTFLIQFLRDVHCICSRTW